MKRSRILPLLGPALVLYLVADTASAGPLASFSIALATIAVLLALAPFGGNRRAADAGIRRVGGLGVALGAALVSAVEPSALSLPSEVVGAIAWPVAGLLLLDLAATVPDRPRALDLPWGRALAVVLAIAAATSGVLAVIPPPVIWGWALIAPAQCQWFPAGFAAVALTLTTAARSARRFLDGTPEAKASNAWALMGAWVSLACAATAALLVVNGSLDDGSTWTRGLIATAAVSTVLGHLLMVDARRQLSAGPSTRALLAAGTTLALVGAAVAHGRSWIPSDPLTLGLWTAATAAVAAALYRSLVPLADWLLEPFGGRLLRSASAAITGLADATTLPDVARITLAAMRQSCGAPEGQPLLYTVHPDQEGRIDAAGEPHWSRRSMPEALAAHLTEHPFEIVVRAPLERLVVRRPRLRALVECLVELDAFCVLPLHVDEHLEGAVVIPRGRRGAALTLEEREQLRTLGTRLAALLCVLLARKRAQDRAGQGDTARKDLQEKVEQLEEELTRVRASAHAFAAGPAATAPEESVVAYSPAMREVMRRVRALGPMEAPALLVAPEGARVEQVAQQLHLRSGRAEGPFLFADCTTERGERARATLFGEEGERTSPGWLRLSMGGSLLLKDVTALPMDVQRELCEALAARQARPVGGAGAYPLDMRLIATSRMPLESLAAEGAFDVELARRLSALHLRVPPLTERAADLPSLVLLALDRACRVAGRPVVGIDQAALDRLVAHDWPGDSRELFWTVDRAVDNCTGPKVLLGDLPALGVAVVRAQPGSHPLDGTLTDVERRVLVRALDRADGNKSQAARALGLKRTTFLDKVRRHDLAGTNGRSDDSPT